MRVFAVMALAGGNSSGRPLDSHASGATLALI